jgi:hypothetical protein
MGIIEDLLGGLAVTFAFSAMLCGFIAFSKDRSWLGFALIGLLLGPLGLIVTGIAEPGSSILPGTSEDPHERSDTPPIDTGKP